MEAGIHGFGNGELSRHHSLADALTFTDSKTHTVSKTQSQSGQSGAETKLSVDSYTNAQGVTQISRPNAQAVVTTRDDLIHATLQQTARTTSVRNGDTTKTHTDATSDLDKTDHATVTNANGTTTIDSKKDVDVKSSSDATSVRKGDTTKTDSDSQATVQVDAHAVITAPNGATTTVDGHKTVAVSSEAESSVTAKVKSESEKTAAGTQTTTTVNSKSDGERATDFSVTANGTIVDSHGHTITLKQVGHGETEISTQGSAKSTSVTLAQTKRVDGKTTETSGETISKTTSESERDSTTTYEGVLSSTTANGKTTTRYVDYVVEEDVQTKATTTSVDDFTAQNHAATQASGKPSGTVTQTVDATSDSQSAIISQRSDAVHATSKPDHDHDATTVTSTDKVDADSLRETDFQNQAHVVTNNGAVTTTSDRSVNGETVVSTQTDATVNTKSTTEKIAGGTVQTVNRTTNAQSDVEALTSYDAQSSSSSSNGASSTRTDHVVSATDYDIHRITRYVAIVRTVVTDAAAQTTFAASA